MRRTLFIMILFMTASSMLGPVYAETLPSGGDLIAGDALITTPASDHLKVNQSSDRSVIQWDSFDIGEGAHVEFIQPGTHAATLNIVDAATSSTLAGRLTAVGSVFLINPHGITVTPDGQINTGGAFVASTLDLTDTDGFTSFINGSNVFTFQTGEGKASGTVDNEGAISAQDVLLLGSRVRSSGSVLARMGRVALGSASHATLDLTGDGFLRVLAPADVDGKEALITNSGVISSDGGLVQLKAATAYDAMREAVNMPGTVRARSVSGSDGAIVFSGGDGGSLNISGTVDASPDLGQGDRGGGSIELQGTVVDVDFSEVHLGARGRFSLAADAIDIVENAGYGSWGATEIVENFDRSSIGDLLRAGVNVTLHANRDLTWSGGVHIHEQELTPEAQGKAGDLHLLAGQQVALGGSYSTYNSNWTLTANAKPVFGPAFEGGGWAEISMYSYPSWAEFINENGHLTLEILGGDDSAGLDAYGIELPTRFSGDGITATISPEALGYDYADIRIRGDIGVGGAITLSGHLRTISQESEEGPITTLSGHQVTWTTETEDRITGGLLRFVEDGVVTRFGRGVNRPTGPTADATRLMLGSTAAFFRLYGEVDPGQLELGDLILTLAPHNKLVPGEGVVDEGESPILGIPDGGIPLTEILAPGSIAVTGPGVRAETNAGTGLQYYLLLGATDQLAFKPLETEDSGCCEKSYVSGAAGGYWIDLSDFSETKSRIPLVIEPRPLTVEILDPFTFYRYGSPQPLVTLHGVVNDDEIIAGGTLKPGGPEGSNEIDITYVNMDGGFGMDSRLGRGEYSYAVTQILGARAGNYVLDLTGLTEGDLHILPRLLEYNVGALTRDYGTAELPSASLTGILFNDDVGAIVGLFRGEDGVDNSKRLAVGRYDVKVIGLTGNDADNYELAGGSDGWLEVQPISVTWKVADASTVYGTMATFDVTFDGVLEGDDVGANVRLRDLDEPLSFRTSVGSYATVVDFLTGADAGNYALVADWMDPRNTAGILTIDPKVLSIDTTPISIVYGDTSDGRFFGEVPLPRLIGALSGDKVLLKRGYVQRVAVGEAHGPDLADIGVGEYELRIVVDGDGGALLEGSHSHNYVLPIGVHSLGLRVTPKPLDVTVGDATTEYGTGWASPEIAFDGVLGGDQVFGSITLWRGDEEFDFHSRTPVGLYTTRVTGLWGDAAANYMISPTGQRQGLLDITPKMLQFTAPVSIVYGDELRFRAGVQHGVLAQDSVQVAFELRSSDGTVILRPKVGTYTGVATEITGGDAGNYALPQESDRILADLMIAKRPITVHISELFRTYGDHPQGIPAQIDNLVPGDAPPILSLTFGVSKDAEGSQIPLTERTGVGNYRLGVMAIDDPNYTLAPSGHTEGQLQIMPKPIRYITFDKEVEYGATDPVFTGFNAAELFAEDILPGDQVYASVVVVANRELYPDRLQAIAKYPLALSGLGGVHSGNYVIEHVGSIQGLLTVTPRPISPQFDLYYNGNPLGTSEWKFGDLELEYGFPVIGGDGFLVNPNLSGVLPGDDVSLSIIAPDLERSSQGYVAVGEYVWSAGHLIGIDSSNYVLDSTMTRTLDIRPRSVKLMIGVDDMVYGDVLDYLDLRFDGDDDRFFYRNDALDISNLVIRTADDFKISVEDFMNELPVRLQVGFYYLGRADEGAPILLGADAKNFNVSFAGSLEVAPRPLTFTPPSTDWIYGQTFTERFLYGDVLGPGGSTGILHGDDVSVEYYHLGTGIGENNEGARLYSDDRYNPAGEYSGIGFRLNGEDARNYEVIQPDYTVTILPRPLWLPMDTGAAPPPFYTTFGDELRPVAGRFGGILPLDAEDLVIGIRGEDGTLQPVHLTDAGRYRLDTVGLVGRRAGNYVLETGFPNSDLIIEPRDVFFVIEDVLGQYGNFLGCLDPATCNGGPKGPHGANYLWVPGLTLGDLELEGVLAGHEVKPGEVVLLDALGRIGSLDDVPPPGVYFQVLEGLSGQDARNYRIAATGSRPGILTITPQWVLWQTHHGLYMPETGMLTLPDDFSDEFVQGLVPTLKTGTNEHELQATFHFIQLDEFFEEVRVVDGSRLTPGNYTVVVSGLAGPFSDNYQVVPRELARGEGVLTVFRDSTLGLDFVGHVADPFTYDPHAEEEEFETAAGPSLGGGAPSGAGGLLNGTSDAAADEAGGGFGYDIDYSLLDLGNGQAAAYADVLVEYGVSGVTLSAKGGVSVQYEVGKGYVEVGAEAAAAARAGVGPTGARASAEAEAGVRAGGGVEGSLGGGVSGAASGSVEVGARARVQTGVGLENGRLRVGSQAQAGAGVSASGRVGVSGDGYAVSTGATVYGPGTLAKDVSVSAGFSGGVFTLSGRFGVAIGLFGLGFDFDLAIDFNKILDGIESGGCSIGLWECPPDIFAMGRDAATYAASMGDPVARFEYLVNQPEWTVIGEAIQMDMDVPQAVRQAYEENMAFYNRYVQMLRDVETYISIQQREHDRFYRQLQNNPYDALMIARGIAQEQEMYGGLYEAQQMAETLLDEMNALGVRLAIVDGEVKMRGRWEY